MTRTGKITTSVIGVFLLLIVVLIIVIATFDWNRLKPTINQKVSTELNRPFAIRGDLGVVWERQKQETGWRSWVPWPLVHAEDITSATRQIFLTSPWCICRVLKLRSPRWHC